MAGMRMVLVGPYLLLGTHPGWGALSQATALDYIDMGGVIHHSTTMVTPRAMIYVGHCTIRSGIIVRLEMRYLLYLVSIRKAPTTGG